MELWMIEQQIDVSGLVPARYARYRPMVVDSLAFFLEHLPPHRLAEILNDQTAPPVDAKPATRLVHFMHACPALHKLGQVLARHRHLDPELQQRLQRLETMEPRTPLADIEPLIRRELGPNLDKYHIRLAHKPLAEASVAVVLPITWSDPGDRRRERHGVLKVLKPGIHQRMQEDLDVVAKLADHFDSQVAHGTLPAIAYRDTFDEARELLKHEVHLEEEQAHLAVAAEQYAGCPDIHIPSLLPFATRHITAMERVYGQKVTNIADMPTAQRRRLARTIVRSLLGDVMFSREPDSLFHGDPHAGNLFATTDGRLAVLDWSLAGRLTQSDRISLMQMLLGGLMLDAGRIAAAIRQLARHPPRGEAVVRLVDKALTSFCSARLPGPQWLMRLLDDLAMAGVRFAPNLMLFRKAFFTLEGVVSDVWEGRSIESLLVDSAIEHLANDWPLRAFKPLWSRDFDTHLSTAELLQAMTAAPLAMMQCWARRIGDAFRGAGFSPSLRTARI